MINVIISGPYGRMGQALCRLVNEAEDLSLAGGLVADAGGSGRTGHGSIVPQRIAAALEDIIRSDGSGAADGNGHSTAGSGGFVLIDFTSPEATVARVREAAVLGVAVVIGTTGFSHDQQAEIELHAKQIPVVQAANMSVGVNVLLGIVQDLAARLKTYDIEVIETHHRLKKDSPSGTALALANAAAAGRAVELHEVVRHGRQGMTGERTAEEIGIHAVRGGDVVGDHTVLFAGTGERLEVVHKASSRDAFASGALAAVRFVADSKPGLYSMKDVLGLR